MESVKCKCGCGLEIDKFDSQGRERKYIRYHCWNDPEYKEKRVKKMKLKWLDPEFRKKHKEAMNRPETKKLISENSKRQMANPDIKNRMIDTMRKKFANPKMRKKISEKTKEAMKSIDLSGPNNSQWKGGVSIEPYCRTWTDKEFKEFIFERDSHTCQNPDCWGKSRILVRHHIDYDKKNCIPENIITLCNSCNVRANTKRNYWQKLYEEEILGENIL